MSLLDEICADVQRAKVSRGLAGFALGFPQLDLAAWQFGRTRLLEHPMPHGSAAASREDGPEICLATQLFRDGGHTALIGDFVRARAERGRRMHLIVTNAGREAVPLSPEIRARTGLAATEVTELLSGTLVERFTILANKLVELGPSRTFLFHHPEDPLAVAAAQPSLCGRCFLVHHSDARPSLGLYIPDVSVIELNPIAAALARVLRLDAQLLLLTCPDPGPRAERFLGDGHLVTASSGSPWKFAGSVPSTYADAVSAILKTTGGRHVHIGALDEATLADIRSRLASDDIDPAAFVHRNWVPSVAAALLEEGCDVFFASFPVDGARTLIEVAAAGTPYLAHAARRSVNDGPLALDLPGGMSWTSLEDIGRVLNALSDRRVLADKSRSARDWYLRLHHPTVFAETLENIVTGRGGTEDPDGAQRDFDALARLTRRLAENALQIESIPPPVAAAAIGETAAKTPAPEVTVRRPRSPRRHRAWKILPKGVRRRVRVLWRPT